MIIVLTTARILYRDITDRGAAVVITASASASFRYRLFFPWLRLFQKQAKYAQPEALGGPNSHLITKNL